MASYLQKHTELMAGKGLHKSPLATQSCYYYLVPKLPHACSPAGAEPSAEPSCLSVCLSGTRYSRPSWTEVENTSEIILPHPLFCRLKFRAREEKGLSRGRAFQAEGTASAKASVLEPVCFLQERPMGLKSAKISKQGREASRSP